MVHLSTLSSISETSKKRLGRGPGSGKGAKSGRGTTRHQKARGAIPLSFEGGQGKLNKKYPLLRGKSRNKATTPKAHLITLTELNAIDLKEISVQSLFEAKIIPPEALKSGVKVLANGEITKALTIKLPLSKNAKAKIEAAGGTVLTV